MSWFCWRLGLGGLVVVVASVGMGVALSQALFAFGILGFRESSASYVWGAFSNQFVGAMSSSAARNGIF